MSPAAARCHHEFAAAQRTLPRGGHNDQLVARSRRPPPRHKEAACVVRRPFARIVVLRIRFPLLFNRFITSIFYFSLSFSSQFPIPGIFFLRPRFNLDFGGNKQWNKPVAIVRFDRPYIYVRKKKQNYSSFRAAEEKKLRCFPFLITEAFGQKQWAAIITLEIELVQRQRGIVMHQISMIKKLQR